MTTNVTGADDLARALSHLAAIAHADVLTAVAKEAMEPILEEAQRLVPVQSGDLRDSITPEVITQQDGSVEVGIGSELPYAARIEFGYDDSDARGRTYHQNAQPYLRPALDHGAVDAVDAVTAALQQRIAEVGG